MEKQRVKPMVSEAKQQAGNRKLTVVAKGRQEGAFDRIEIATHEWFLSDVKKEIYRYKKGIFEAHLEAEVGTYHLHHTLKVLPPDAIQFEVKETEQGQLIVTERHEWFYSVSKDQIYKKGKAVEHYVSDNGGWYKRGTQETPGLDATAIEIEQDEEGRVRIRAHKTQWVERMEGNNLTEGD